MLEAKSFSNNDSLTRHSIEVHTLIRRFVLQNEDFYEESQNWNDGLPGLVCEERIPEGQDIR